MRPFGSSLLSGTETYQWRWRRKEGQGGNSDATTFCVPLSGEGPSTSEQRIRLFSFSAQGPSTQAHVLARARLASLAEAAEAADRSRLAQGLRWNTENPPRQARKEASRGRQDLASPVGDESNQGAARARQRNSCLKAVKWPVLRSKWPLSGRKARLFPPC